ncbi:MAG: DUF1735 domain-containing protein [Phycisphaerae bacterium]|nr:DUF1735 domain-containing protein [Phycisphaerae bacterium]
MKYTPKIYIPRGLGYPPRWRLPVSTVLLLLLTATVGAQEGPTDAISREISVYVEVEAEVLPPTDAISREVSVHNNPAEPSEATDAISREVSVFSDQVNPVEVTDAISRETSAFLIQILELGVSFSDTIEIGEEVYFRLTTPPDLTVRISLDHASETAWTELYASLGQLPTDADADFVFDNPSAPDQELIIPNTEAGTYYIMLRHTAESDPAAATSYTILAEDLPFGLRSVEPGVIGAGTATLQINGARLTDETTYVLIDRLTDDAYTPETIEFLDPATALAKFDMSNAEMGLYDVVASEPGGVEAVLTEGLEVAEPTDMRFLELQMEFPAAVRGGAVGKGVVRIRNTGNVDIPVVQVQVMIPKDPNVEIWADNFPDGSVEQTSGPYEGFALFYVDVRPAESRSIPISFVANTSFPGHGLVRFSATAAAFSREEYRDGPYFEMCEVFRLGLLSDPETPEEVLELAADQDLWWELMHARFDDFLSGLTRRGERSIFGHVVCAAGCHVFCHTVLGWTGVLNWVCVGICHVGVCDWMLLPDDAHGDDTTSSAETEIIQAWDPNEKVGAGGFGEDIFVDSAKPLPYHIDFENLPEATAPAAEIYITDALDPALDPTTLRIGRIHFGDTTIEVPPDRSSYHTVVDVFDQHGVLVEVIAGVDLETREVRFSLRALDPKTMQLPWDPTLGFLPPNDETGRGEGFVEFTIEPYPSTPTGTIIWNQASIVFDYNDPIETNEVFNTIDSGAPVTTVQTLPAESMTPFVLRWAGADDESGSGLAQYHIYVSVDGGPAEPWHSGTDTWAYFPGEVGSSYEFYSIGVDNVGNVEDMPPVPQATTTVTGHRSGGDIDLDGDTDLDDLSLLIGSCFAGPATEAPDDPDYCKEADLNGDRRVDLRDFAILQANVFVPLTSGADLRDFARLQQCFTGDAGGPVTGNCARFDLDEDNDVDLDDFSEFVGYCTGPQ